MKQPRNVGALFGYESLAELDNSLAHQCSDRSLDATIRELEDCLEVAEDCIGQELNKLDVSGWCNLLRLNEATYLKRLCETTKRLAAAGEDNPALLMRLCLAVGRLTVVVKHRDSEHDAAVGCKLAANQQRGAKTTRKERPSRKELAEALNRSREMGHKEAIVDQLAAMQFGVKLSLLRRWKREYSLRKKD